MAHETSSAVAAETTTSCLALVPTHLRVAQATTILAVERDIRSTEAALATISWRRPVRQASAHYEIGLSTAAWETLISPWLTIAIPTPTAARQSKSSLSNGVRAS